LGGISVELKCSICAGGGGDENWGGGDSNLEGMEGVDSSRRERRGEGLEC